MTDDYDSKKKKLVEECLELNKKNPEYQERKDKETMKMLQEALDRDGLDIEVVGKVEWKPGDPVTNNAELMLQNEWEQNATEEEAKKVNPYLFRATDGVMRDMRYTAPERFPKNEKDEG